MESRDTPEVITAVSAALQGESLTMLGNPSCEVSIHIWTNRLWEPASMNAMVDNPFTGIRLMAGSFPGDSFKKSPSDRVRERFVDS